MGRKGRGDIWRYGGKGVNLQGERGSKRTRYTRGTRYTRRTRGTRYTRRD